jgi:hypothetical protein
MATMTARELLLQVRAANAWRPNRGDFEFGPQFYSHELGHLRELEADALDPISPDFGDACDGRDARTLERLIAPDFRLEWGGVEVSGSIGYGEPAVTDDDVREVAHHPASRAGVIQAHRDLCAQERDL